LGCVWPGAWVLIGYSAIYSAIILVGWIAFN
jgi:hypothetical protein